MTPTTNSILAAYCNYYEATPIVSYLRAIDGPVNYATHSLRVALSNNESLDEFFSMMVEPKRQPIRVRIASLQETKLEAIVYNSLQIPVEPFCTWEYAHLALCWVINNEKQVYFTNFKGEPTLLAQAYLAGLINTIDDSEPPADDLHSEPDEDGKLRKLRNPIRHGGNYLLQSEVLLGFDLAGLSAPFKYETWRTPDGVNTPRRATIKSLPHFGDCTVHWHDGEEALVSSGDWMQCAVVKVKWLESTAQKDVEGMVKRNKKEPELTDEQVKQLADKYD